MVHTHVFVLSVKAVHGAIFIFIIHIGGGVYNLWSCLRVCAIKQQTKMM